MPAVVTLLFVDQVSSTAQLSQLGDVRAQRIRQAMFDALREALTAFGGREVDFTGDGLFAAFDSASQGVDAAVTMQQLVGALNRRHADVEHVSIRIGVHIGEPLTNGEGYFGQAVVVARRLCDRADAGQIFVSDIVRSLVAPHGTHSFSSLGDLELKGISDLVASCLIEYEPDERGAVLPEQLVLRSAFVGRATALERLARHWEHASGGHRAVVLIDGDAGIGKTSVAAAFAATVQEAGGRVWYGRAEPVVRLSAWAGAIESLASTSSRAELRLSLGRHANDLARLAPILIDRLPGLDPPSALEAEAATYVAADALVAVVERVATETPLLIVLDDLDDADEVTLTVLRRLVASDRSLRLMILGLHRVQAIGRTRLSALVADSAVDSFELRGLDLDEVTQLIEAITGRPPATATAESLLAESEGNPYFVVRMARVQAERFVERRVIDAVQRSEAVRDDLRLVREELSMNLRQLDELRSDEASTSMGAVVEADGTPPEIMRCPYRGLAAFQTTDAEWFFGREPMVASIVAKMASSSLIGVIGASGSGKSSIIRAGVLPALARDALPGSSTWLHTTITPGADPMAALAAGLCDIAPALSEPETMERLRRHGLAATAANLIGADQSGVRLLLIIDQFEEVFTTSTNQAANEFMDALVKAAESPHIMVVVTLRADFYGHCGAHPGFAAALQDSQVLLGPMTRAELHRAITGPALVGGLVMEPGLADAIVYDASDQPGLLPLVSTALLETWERRRGRSLTLAGYAEAGGVRGAIARLADDTYESLDEAGRHEVRRIMLRLASPGDDGHDFRRRVPLPEVANSETAKATIATLADRRLVTVDGDSVEVAHEALFREWPRLRGWLSDDRDGRRLRQQIAIASGEWERADRDDALLLRGSRMAAALDYAASGRADMNSAEVEFLDASRQRADAELAAARRTTRRLRGLLIGVAIVLVVAVAAGAFAFVQRGRAEARSLASKARDLASRSESSRDPYAKLLLAIESELTTPSPSSAARTAWADASVAIADQAALLDRAPIPTSGTTATSLSWNPVTSALAVANADGAVSLIEPNGSSSTALVKAGESAGASTVVWDPSGQRLAGASAGGSLRMFDSSGALVSESDGNPANQVSSGNGSSEILWAASGLTVAVASSHGLAFADRDGRILTTNPDLTCADAQWNPAGTRLVAVCNRKLVIFDDDGNLTTPPDALSSLGGETMAASWDPSSGNLGAYNTEAGLLIVDVDGAVVWQRNELAEPKGAASLHVELDWSPDGAFVALHKFDPVQPFVRVLRLFAGDTGTPAPGHDRDADDTPSLVAWNPTSHAFATGSVTGTVEIVDVDDSAGTAVAPVDVGPIAPTSLAWDQSGTLLAVLGGDGSVTLVEASGERLGQELTFQSGVTSLQWSSPGSVLAVGDRAGTVRVLRPNPRRTTILAGGGVPEWSPDGQFLAGVATRSQPDHTLSFDGDLVLAAADGRQLAQIKRSALLYSSSRSWSRDSSRLVTFALGGDNELLDASVIDSAGHVLFTIPNDSATVTDQIDYLEWAHRSDDLLVTTGHSVSVYDEDFKVVIGPLEIGSQVFPIDTTRVLAVERHAARDEWNFDDSAIALLVHSASNPGALDVAVLRVGDRDLAPAINFGTFKPTAIAWSRVDDTLAVGGQDGSLRFVTGHGTVVSDPIRGGGAPITFLQWAGPDRLLTKDSSGVVRAYNGDGRKVGEVDGQQQCGDPMPSPNGAAFVVSCGASLVSFYDKNAKPTGSYSSADDLSPPSWAPDGTMLAVADSQGRLQFVAIDGTLLGGTSAFAPAGTAGLPFLFWAPDGGVLLGGYPSDGSFYYAWSENDACQYLLRYFDASAMEAMLGPNGGASRCETRDGVHSLSPIPLMQGRPDR